MDHGQDSPSSTRADWQADDRLIHALLLHLHDGRAAEHRERRVGRAMQAVRGPAESRATGEPALAPARARPAPPLRVWALRGAWAAAAMALVAVGALVVSSLQTPALASLSDVLGALGRPGDRTFRIRVEGASPAETQGPREGQAPAVPPRPGLDGATLYLRDGRQFLLVRADPRGGELFDGYDGRQSWRVRGGVLVEARDGLGAGGIPMPQIMADVPFADLHRTLGRIGVDYTVERLDQAPLRPGGEASRHVLARRSLHEARGPQTIEIWADPRTGMPRRIVFDQAKFQGSPEPRRLTFELLSEKLLPADWFSHTAHTAGGAGDGH